MAYRVVGVEPDTKVSQCREEFSLHHPGEGMADARASSPAVRRAEGSDSPSDRVVHALVDRG